jgi:hypothetical protein
LGQLFRAGYMDSSTGFHESQFQDAEIRTRFTGISGCPAGRAVYGDSGHRMRGATLSGRLRNLAFGGPNRPTICVRLPLQTEVICGPNSWFSRSLAGFLQARPPIRNFEISRRLSPVDRRFRIFRQL